MPSALIRRLTYFEAIFFAIMVATTESYALYYFTKNGLSHTEIAVLASFPLLVGATAQLAVPWLTKRWPVGVTLICAILVQSIGIALILHFLLYPGPFWLLVASFMLYWAGGQTSAPMWMDWASKIISAQDFPQYLGRRNIIATLVVLCFYVTCSFLLKDKSSFALLFTGGLIARLSSLALQAFLVARTPHKNIGKEIVQDKSEAMTSLPFERRRIFITFFLISGLFRMACYLCSPFFMPYMINDLKLNTVDYVLLTAIPYIGRAMFIQNWGRASKGIRPFWGAQIAAVFIAFLPPLWMLGTNFYYLSFLQILSGIFWGGMEITMLLVVQNLYYGKARFLLSVQNTILVFFSVLGSLIGAQLLSSGLTYFNVFFISGCLRFIIAILLIFTLNKYHRISLHSWNGRVYLTSILSLRPSLEAVGRIILSPRPRTKKN
ncbi:MAG: MFS transporter [Bdellovibrio sp.]|nr:MFS transporter [Bdellovibrio sp.]